ncbi:hypothetical protein GQ43DRAFT_442925 [Delitschia confertaspora ATCC 74209]|uniref:SRP9 domain-containing protein n=1 Tax=Delitschia confertaspora ATCC 74209 TaxID=1513339 RepID=A0A9P4MQ38_9PLEO|nr:hypothetical protein GQ43DRAFT_442925 [Delitschia confertaspora ATCC 74209]
MPFYPSNAEWFEQSSMLIKAHPRTTRITSKYTVIDPSSSNNSKRRQKKLAKRKSTVTGENATATDDPLTSVVATFRLTTYDPVSGTNLQYQTDKAAEVGRLVGCLGRLARTMAALPDATTDFTLPAESGTGISTPTVEGGNEKKLGTTVAATMEKPIGPNSGAGGGGAGGKKKKKGKK